MLQMSQICPKKTGHVVYGYPQIQYLLKVNENNIINLTYFQYLTQLSDELSQKSYQSKVLYPFIDKGHYSENIRKVNR